MEAANMEGIIMTGIVMTGGNRNLRWNLNFCNWEMIFHQKLWEIFLICFLSLIYWISNYSTRYSTNHDEMTVSNTRRIGSSRYGSDDDHIIKISKSQERDIYERGTYGIDEIDRKKV